MPFLLFLMRFENLKIIKIRIPSHPRHIVTVHSEVSTGESIALLVGENVIFLVNQVGRQLSCLSLDVFQLCELRCAAAHIQRCDKIGARAETNLHTRRLEDGDTQ